jgi:hypothetical protein
LHFKLEPKLRYHRESILLIVLVKFLEDT